ncbi:Vascular non-inflammatory molecule 3 [Araneus ventricosus]|uniref:Vascular non-inflammatory molecule 3 n=1 Tax=Araneus ventricosus TaxID=182803 RepID=A0A4Y2Q0H1_ARAVE|nr:Vascular non-inflammatory molecule 3 [Araneus ventricosus]
MSRIEYPLPFVCLDIQLLTASIWIPVLLRSLRPKRVMTAMDNVVLVLSLVCFVTFSTAESHLDYYTAAVFEHAKIRTPNDSASSIIQRNLRFYFSAANEAKSQGADVIVFPEYGIIPPGKRDELKKFLEYIPDPKESRVNPCEQNDAYSSRPILNTLSCMAKANSIFVVANMGDIQKCENDLRCPEDGVFQFNANVVFDRDGTLVLKYHKEHLNFEFGMDLAREQQDSTFETDFGTFATYNCFDIDFQRMSEVARSPGIDGIMLTAIYGNRAPLKTTVQFWEAWALGNNATLLVANLQMPGDLSMGSGIFHGENGALGYTFNPDGLSKLVVARVPKLKSPEISPESNITVIYPDYSVNWNMTTDLPAECSLKLLNQSNDISTDYRCTEENITFSFVPLKESSGHIETCHNGLCCALDYQTKGLNDQFFLGAFSGMYSHFGRYFWCEEDCVLARCDPFGDSPCATYPTKSLTVFEHVHLSGNFSSEVVYPSVLESGSKLVSRTEWRHQRSNQNETSVIFQNGHGRNLLVVGLKGRCFERDPPYQQ